MDTKVSIVKGAKNPDEKEIRVMVEKAIDLTDEKKKDRHRVGHGAVC